MDVVTGKVFTVPKTDLYLPGRFNLNFLRSYSTGHSDIDVGLGFGWRHSFAWWLEEKKKLTVFTGDGRRLDFDPPPEPAGTMEVGAWAIMRGADFIAVRPGNEFVHLFVPDPEHTGRYRLARVVFRKRGYLIFDYEGARLARVIDTVGRAIVFEPSEVPGRLGGIRVTNPKTGQTIAFARYAYDGAGNLIAVRDADGQITRYGYDDSHRLTRLEYPSGLILHYVYDQKGRCIETWGDRATVVDPALADDLPDLLCDRATPARGIYHCKLDFVDPEYTEVSDSVRFRRFFAGPDDRVGKAVSARGGVTTRIFDETGRVVSQTDPTEATWFYEYDDQDQLVREVDPEGHAIALRRDGAGREIEVVDPAGGITTIGRDAYGEIISSRDQSGRTIEFKLTEYGLVSEIIDSRGARHLLSYDEHANVTSRTFPNGARLQFEYDYWGRLIREVNPVGAAATWTWTDSGLPLSFTDPLQRTTRWRWDAMGNLAGEILPGGSATELEYGGLNWLCRARLPDGSERRGFYNREGWLVRYLNEHGEAAVFDHDEEGSIAREVMFHGHESRYGYDSLGRLLWFDNGFGRHERTLDKAGNILREEAPGGSIRSYEYNARNELVRAKSGDVELEWALDPVGRLTREVLRVDGRTYSTESVLDAAGDRAGFQTSLGHGLEIRRDANGQVQELWDRDGRVLGIERSPTGRPVRWDFGRGGAVLDTYDAANRLVRREIAATDQARGSVAQPAYVGGRGPASAGFTFDYTPVEEIARVTELDGGTVEYEYDARRHVRRRIANGAAQEFAVDRCSNYIEQGPNEVPRRYERGNVLVALGDKSYRYDARGFLVEKRQARPGQDDLVTRYEWNDWGLLQAVLTPDDTRLEFKYDPFARRLAKSVYRYGEHVETHHYVWDRLSLVHEVCLDAAGNQSDVQTFLFEENYQVIPLGQRAPSGWTYYVHDPNGVPLQIVNGAGQVVARLDRDFFGEVRSRGPITTPFRLPGQWADSETGLHYNRYRYYDPESGRFISPDPIGLDGSINLFALGPNPIGWSDPMGWQHNMTVTSNTGPMGTFQPWGGPTGNAGPSNQLVGQSGAYQSGRASQMNPCPPLLDNRANCHTEQRFADDLIRASRAGQVQQGQQFNLTGEFPPCPNCHAALRRAAAETGTKIKYQWECPKGTVKGVIEYNGSAEPKFSNHPDAQALLAGGYNQQTNQGTYFLAPNWQKGDSTRWGYQTPGSAYEAYTNVMNSGGYR